MDWLVTAIAARGNHRAELNISKKLGPGFPSPNFYYYYYLTTFLVIVLHAFSNGLHASDLQNC